MSDIRKEAQYLVQLVQDSYITLLHKTQIMIQQEYHFVIRNVYSKTQHTLSVCKRDSPHNPSFFDSYKFLDQTPYSSPLKSVNQGFIFSKNKI